MRLWGKKPQDIFDLPARLTGCSCSRYCCFCTGVVAATKPAPVAVLPKVMQIVQVAGSAEFYDCDFRPSSRVGRTYFFAPALLFLFSASRGFSYAPLPFEVCRRGKLCYGQYLLWLRCKLVGSNVTLPLPSIVDLNELCGPVHARSLARTLGPRWVLLFRGPM